ncbi:DUF1330 domain-containing protein [Hoeflea sp. TYP-13]|uniref:DUF1330 domain-containing protein n=1 Tax=Hoeflea sp. TYP-13 TaxID=3230023 RepID=UPI0034C6B249
MTTHAIVTLTITAPEQLTAYRERAGEALAKHGGAVAQASRELTLLEGGPDLPQLAAVLTFPDQVSARAWIDDPALADVHALRRGSGHSTIILL